MSVGHSTLILLAFEFFFVFIALCSLNDGLYGWLTFVLFHCSALICALYEHHPRILFSHV